MINKHQNTILHGVLILSLLLCVLFSGCSEFLISTPPKETGYGIYTQIEERPPESEGERQKTTTSFIPVGPTRSGYPMSVYSTVSPKYDPEYIFGSYIFGDSEYSIYADGSRIALFDPDTQAEIVSVEDKTPENMNLFILSVSLVDYNFDGIPDFSYCSDDSGMRTVYLGEKNREEISFVYCSELSSLYQLSRCYETETIFGKEFADEEYFTSFQYKKCLIGDDDPLPINDDYEPQPGDVVETMFLWIDILDEEYVWDLQSIASAFSGTSAEEYEVTDVLIRQMECHSVQISNYLTVAYDDYGNYYIKDMLGSGYCRLMLNPDGHWSTGERVGN